MKLLNSTLASAGSRSRTKSRKACADFFRVLIADEAERNFRRRLARDDRLRAFAGIAADHSVDLSRRTGRNLLDEHPILLAGRDFKSHLTKKLLRRQAKPGKLLFHLRGEFVDAFIEARNGHPPIRVVHGAQNMREHPQADSAPRRRTVRNADRGRRR